MFRQVNTAALKKVFPDAPKATCFGGKNALFVQSEPPNPSSTGIEKLPDVVSNDASVRRDKFTLPKDDEIPSSNNLKQSKSPVGIDWGDDVSDDAKDSPPAQTLGEKTQANDIDHSKNDTVKSKAVRNFYVLIFFIF
jgi:hypothetical protein